MKLLKYLMSYVSWVSLLCQCCICSIIIHVTTERDWQGGCNVILNTYERYFVANIERGEYWVRLHRYVIWVCFHCEKKLKVQVSKREEILQDSLYYDEIDENCIKNKYNDTLWSILLNFDIKSKIFWVMKHGQKCSKNYESETFQIFWDKIFCKFWK